MNHLEALRDGWDGAAKDDPMFNILTLPGMQGAWTADEFFANGRRQMQGVSDWLGELYARPSRRNLALDFGCGIGRLTQAIAPDYKRTVGVDISPEMIREAKRLDQHGCLYLTNEEPNLKVLGSDLYDFIYTTITLQHMPHDLQAGYVEEFLRLLHPGGALVLEIPEGPEIEHPSPWLSMHGVDRAEVTRWVFASGGKVEQVEDIGQDASWTNLRYLVTKS